VSAGEDTTYTLVAHDEYDEHDVEIVREGLSVAEVVEQVGALLRGGDVDEITILRVTHIWKAARS
jgi:hypothetical protein